MSNQLKVPQFGLRTALIVVTILAIILGVVRWGNVRREAKQRLEEQLELKHVFDDYRVSEPRRIAAVWQRGRQEE